MNAKYDRIGINYDQTRMADPGVVESLVSYLDIEKKGRYLDVACGSGNYTSSSSLNGGDWFGIDVSSVMLSKARTKSLDVNWIQAQVDELPFKDSCFDGAMCTLAIHHFPSLEQAFSDVRRVLKRGRFVVFTSTTEQMKGYWLQKYFPVAMRASWEQMPSRYSIEKALIAANFDVGAIEPYFVTNELRDLFLYSGKHRPELYLEPEFRKGISTFSSLAKDEEVRTGCEQLRFDIKSGKIKEVIQKFQNDLGDYCFFVSESK